MQYGNPYMTNIFEKEIISLIENGIRNMNYNDHSYDTAKDIYESISNYLIRIYDKGYTDGMEYTDDQ